MTCLALPRPGVAGPEGGTVVAGSAGIVQSGAVTNINQSSNRAIINWQSFSVGRSETVNFNQPSASSATLNRVTGSESSVIAGALNANGQVFLVNPNGVLFSKGAQVNVGGLVASTLDISNANFMAGNYVFEGSSSASVVNQGHIRAGSGGYVSLLGKTVSNEGVISARLGTVAMASGEKITLNFEGNSLLDVTIDKGTLNAMVSNKQLIRANGGTVIMTAKAADNILSAQVNNSGVIQARSMASLKGGSSSGGVKLGKIKMIADGGTVTNSGKLDASAPKGGDGGFIETSGNKVNITDSSVITTKSAYGSNGTWLIDPYNIIIASTATTGGSFDNGTPTDTFTATGSSVIDVATLQTALASNNVVISTGAAGSAGSDAGDITVNAAITNWSANTTLTLNAAHDIVINKAITADGDSAGLTLNAGNNININNAVTLNGAHATLTMNYGGYNGTTVLTPLAGTNYNILTKASYSGAVLDADGIPVAQQDTSGGVYGSVTFTNAANTKANNPNGLVINGQAYTLIHSLADIATTGTATGYFAIAQNIDATSWSSANTGIASVISTLSGTLAGLGNVVSNLTINSSSGPYLGLIGQANASSIRDVGLLSASITAPAVANDANTHNAGILLGLGTDVDISQVYVQGRIDGQAFQQVGGVAGEMNGGSFDRSFADVAITSGVYAAGVYAGGLINVGGLVGRTTGTSITNSHATGMIDTVATYGGGLVGYATGTPINTSYASVDVTGRPGTSYGRDLGGLVGIFATQLGADNSVRNSFATGSIKGGGPVGGLIAEITQIGTTNAANVLVQNTYATGTVTATASTYQGVGGLIGTIGGTSTISGNVTIDKSFATGDVVSTGGASRVGGLIGQFNGRSGFLSVVSNSYATGNVTSNGTDTGGLAGYLSNVTVTNSYAAGNVSGNSDVGGLAGLAVDSAINNSYALGLVTGNQYVAGAVGYLSNNATLSNVFFNGTSTSVAVGRTRPTSATQTATALNSDQIADAQYYANGTINQVLADRAAQAAQQAAEQAAQQAARQAAEQAANAGGSIVSASLNPQTSSSPTGSSAGAGGFNVPPPTTLDANISIQQSAPNFSIRPAPLTTGSVERRRRQARRNGPNLGATIRAIEVDGQRFNLEAPEQGATPAPSGNGQQ